MNFLAGNGQLMIYNLVFFRTTIRNLKLFIMKKMLRWKYFIASLISFFIIFSNNVAAQCRLLNETFDVNPVLSPTNVDGTWYPDRFRPAGFTSAVLGGNNVLKISIDGIADGALNRPGGQTGTFYNTQGRKFNQCGGCVTVMKGDLWIPSDWATDHRRSDMWASAYDVTNTVSAYPILGFRNPDAASPGIYYWDGNLGQWFNSGVAIVYDSWYSLEFRLAGPNIEYLVNNVVVGTISSNSSKYFGDIIMQAYNFNDPLLLPANQSTDSYDAYWDNLVTTGSNGNVVTNLNTGQTFCSIQAAIDASATLAGHIISVGPGTYNENVNVYKGVTLQSSAGRSMTNINGSASGPLGTIQITTSNVTIGGFGKGFTIRGYDSPSPGLEYAAVYVQGAQNAVTIRDNEIIADGEAGLLTEFGQAVNSFVVNANTFSGKTFVGAEAGDCGFTNQFSAPNVPRQIVNIATGSGITFTSNMINGVAGSSSISCVPYGQGNTIVTIDANNVVIRGNTFAGTTARFGSHLRARGVNTSIYCNTFDNAGLGLACTHIVFNGGLTALTGGANPGSVAGVASANTFISEGAFYTGATQIYRSSAQVVALLQIPIAANSAVMAKVTNVNTGETFCTIQSAIDDANTAAGHTISVAAGTYYEDVVINEGITLSGAGCGLTTISGPIGGGGATIQVGAANVVIEGFTITRDGNNPADWNLALNTAGIAIQGLTNNAEIRNCCIIGNRTGIDININNGNKIHNNFINKNRTGLVFRNQKDKTNCQNNFVTNNWTVGILFLDASGGSNVPVQSAANSTFSNNDISGNWYGEVVDRQTGGALPAPGANAKNFECNWYGAATAPVTSVANSTEPGYAAQIPVIYGGAAVPPGGQPDILGTASANIDYTPWLVNGTDNAAAPGFQPAANSCGGGTPQLNTTINGVTVNSINDGNDDLASFNVCTGTNNIQFNLYADQNGLVHPQYKVYQTLTTANVTVPFCNNCWATMAAFTGASGTASLIDPSTAGTLTMRFKAWLDLNTDNIVDPGEPQGDWIQYTMTVNPTPILRQTYNGVQVAANNDGVDDVGSFTICSSASNNVFLTEITDVQGITPSARVKVEQIVVKTNVTINTAADGVYPLGSIGPIPLGRTATLINPAMNGTVVIKRRAFYDADNSNTLNTGDCAGDWVVYTISLDGEAPTLVGTLPGGAVGNVCQADAPAAPTEASIAALYTDNSTGVTATLLSSVPSGNNCAWSVTYTYSIKDGCNNAASNAVVVFTGGDTQVPTFTRPSDITILFSSPGVYNATVGATGDVLNEWDNCSTGLNATFSDGAGPVACGNNLIITRTWSLVDDCGNAAGNQVQTITVTDNMTNYIIYAKKEAKFGEDNDINGDVGVTDANGKAEFKKGSALDPFKVYAKNINVQMPATVNNKFFVPATGGPNPPFQMYVATPLSGNYTLSVSGTVPAGNYKNLTIKKNVIATVNGCNYGKITIEEGASVTFNCNNMNIEELFVGKGKKGVNVTTVNFGSSTVLKVKDRVTIEEDCRINTNTGAPKVTFYLGDTKKDEENFMIKGDNTQVTANIMIPNGKLKIDKKSDNCIMTGWFIIEKLESTGQTTWNPYDCNAPLIATRKPVSSSDAKTPGTDDKDAFKVSVYPNPSTTDFRILVNSTSEELVSVRIFDVSGRTVKVISQVQSNSYIRVGSELRQGSYFAEVIQGANRQTIKLLKME